MGRDALLASIRRLLDRREIAPSPWGDAAIADGEVYIAEAGVQALERASAAADRASGDRHRDGEVDPAYTDYGGNEVPYYGGSPVTWRISVYVVARIGGSLLLMQPEYSEALELPGGEVMTGESLLEGARRECWEETGYSFHTHDTWPTYAGEQWYFDHSDSGYRHSLFFSFRGTVRPEPDPSWRPIEGETRKVLWLPSEEIDTAEIHPNHRRILASSR